MGNAYTSEALEQFRVASCRDIADPEDIPIRLGHPDIGIRVDLEPIGEVAMGSYRLELRFPPEGVVDVLMSVSLGEDEQFWLRLPAVDRNHFVTHLRVTSRITAIALLVRGSGKVRGPIVFSIVRSHRAAFVISLARRALYVLKRDRFRFVRSATHALLGSMRLGTLAVARGSASHAGEAPYDTWIRVFDENPAHHRQRHEERLATLTRHPMLSCLSSVNDVDTDAIRRLAHDLKQQIYAHWQLVMAAPAPLLPTIRSELELAGVDASQATLIPAERDIASTCNALVSAATGEFVVQIPPGAVLRPHALLEFALVLDRYPDAAMIYSDEDQIDPHGNRSVPQFKPAWSPDYLVVVDYIGHLTLLHRQTLRQTGGWRSGLHGRADHDLKLRITEQMAGRKIVHLAKVLVHLPQVLERPSLSVASASMLEDLVERRQCRAIVEVATERAPRLQFLRAEPPPLVSLIIPTRDRANLLESCVRSILQRTSYKLLEIIVIDNGSKEAATHQLFESLQREPRIRIVRCPGEFNFSALNNLGAQEARGDLLALINNDIEVIDGGWLDEMAALAVRPDVGCVGAKLLYSDGRVQHAAIVTGLGGLAGHWQRFSARDAGGYLDRMYFTHEVSAVTAACLVVRKSVYLEVGGLDEKQLKVAYNDVDFCLKVRRAGYRNLWSPFAELLHHESASRGFDYRPAKAKRFALEANVIRKRWGERLFTDPYYSPNLSYDREEFSLRVR